METPGPAQPSAVPPPMPGGLALWGPLLRLRARTAVGLTGVMHPRLRQLLKDWYVRVQRDAAKAHEACRGVQREAALLARPQRNAEAVAQASARMPAACTLPSFLKTIALRENEIGQLSNDLLSVTKRLDAIAQELNRPEVGSEAAPPPETPPAPQTPTE